jgi:predicted O-methyltransferase YrrM
MSRLAGSRRPGLPHGLRTAARAGLATAAVAAASYLIAPPVAALATVAAAVAVIVFEASRVRASIDRRLDTLEADVAQVEPLLALRDRLAPRRPLPAMRGFAIAPDFALVLTELIADERPELVVETGSGVSTLVIAYGLEQLGRGRVIALDHDAGYVAATRAALERHGLSAYATVVHAPLEPIEIDGEHHRWYARGALAGLPPIDLVVDDGPPRYLGDLLRYASLPELAARIAPRGVFVLDVIADEEREILARWRARFPEFRQQLFESRKGHAILRRAAAEPR